MRLEIKNYQILSESVIDIEGVTLLTGSSNSGKTSHYRAIRDACFGTTGGSFVKKGRANSMVRLVDLNTSAVWEFRREGNSTVFTHDGVETRRTRGVPSEDYRNSLAIKKVDLGRFDVTPNFASQFAPLFIIDLTPLDAATALSFLFGGEKFPLVLKEISKTIRANKKEVIFYEGRVEGLERDVEQLKQKRASLDTIMEVVEQRKSIKSLADEYFTLADTYKECQALEGQIAETVQQKEFLQNNYQVLLALKRDELQEYLYFREDMLKIEEVNKTIHNIMKEVAKTTSWLQDMDINLHTVEDYAQLKEDVEIMEQYEHQIEQLEQSLESERRTAVSVSRRLDDEVKRLKNCPYCGSEVMDSQMKQALIRNIRL